MESLSDLRTTNSRRTSYCLVLPPAAGSSVGGDPPFRIGATSQHSSLGVGCWHQFSRGIFFREPQARAARIGWQCDIRAGRRRIHHVLVVGCGPCGMTRPLGRRALPLLALLAGGGRALSSSSLSRLQRSLPRLLRSLPRSLPRSLQRLLHASSLSPRRRAHTRCTGRAWPSGRSSTRSSPTRTSSCSRRPSWPRPRGREARGPRSITLEFNISRANVGRGRVGSQL